MTFSVSFFFILIVTQFFKTTEKNSCEQKVKIARQSNIKQNEVKLRGLIDARGRFHVQNFLVQQQLSSSLVTGVGYVSSWLLFIRTL
jgi:hypothetical protein